MYSGTWSSWTQLWIAVISLIFYAHQEVRQDSKYCWPLNFTSCPDSSKTESEHFQIQNQKPPLQRFCLESVSGGTLQLYNWVCHELPYNNGKLMMLDHTGSHIFFHWGIKQVTSKVQSNKWPVINKKRPKVQYWFNTLALKELLTCRSKTLANLDQSYINPMIGQNKHLENKIFLLEQIMPFLIKCWLLIYIHHMYMLNIYVESVA